MLRAGTYAIVPHDPARGEVGVVVQSHWFSVGSIVPWTRARVGAQSVPDPATGPRLPVRPEAGEDPDELLFWAGLAAVAAGQKDAGIAQVRRAIEQQLGWSELLTRLPVIFAPAAPRARELLDPPAREHWTSPCGRRAR